MAVVCSEIGEDFPLQGIQDHLFDSGDEENEDGETCECEKPKYPQFIDKNHRPRCGDNI